MAAGPINITIDQRGAAMVVTPVGDIGYTEAKPFQEALRSANDKKTPILVVDLSKVEYINTPGLATLVEALQRTKQRGAKLALAGLTPKVKSIIDLTRLNTVFAIVPDVNAGLQI